MCRSERRLKIILQVKTNMRLQEFSPLMAETKMGPPVKTKDELS